MKRGFLITNGLAFAFAILSIGWLIYDFVAFGILHSKMLRSQPLTAVDGRLSNLIYIGLVVFLLFHVIGFIAVASQFQHFRKASALRIVALVSGIGGCLLILADFAGLADIFNEYEEGIVAGEWKLVYTIAVIRSLAFLAILANLMEAFIQRRNILTKEKAVKDEVVFTLVHGVGAFCGVVGLFFSNAAFAFRLAHPMLHITFPFVFVFTLIPYGLLAGYWLAIKLKAKSAGW